MASENEHDDIEDIIFGADSKSEHDQRKLHADTAGIDPPTCSQCHFARWPARVSDNGRSPRRNMSSKTSGTARARLAFTLLINLLQ